MTPAEQGQEKLGRCSVKRVELLEMTLATCQRELEMCQRYFPFMRRSRDEAVKREKALREALVELLQIAEGVESGALGRFALVDSTTKARAALDQSGKP